MAKDGTLLLDGSQSIKDLILANDCVKVIEGRVYQCSKFGKVAAHAEFSECKEVKGLRADAFVLCSSYYLYQQLNELRLYLPIMRAPSELILRTNGDLTHKLLSLNGLSSTMTPDNLPLLGNSLNLANVYFFTGFSSASLALRVQAAKQFVNYFVDGETSTI